MTLPSGKIGYINRDFLWRHLPEPESRIRRIASGETPLGIAATHYGADFKRWGQDTRYVVNALVYVNTRANHNGVGQPGLYKPGNDTSANWAETRATADAYIWMPSTNYINAIYEEVRTRGGGSGSISFDLLASVADRIGAVAIVPAFVGGLVHGFIQCVVDTVMEIVDLLKSIVTGEIIDDLKALFQAITQLTLDDIGAMFEAWWLSWKPRLTSQNPFVKGHAWGYLVGYLVGEIALALVGAAAAKLAAKLATKLGKIIGKIAPKLEKAIGTLKGAGGKTRELLDQAKDKIARKLGLKGAKKIAQEIGEDAARQLITELGEDAAEAVVVKLRRTLSPEELRKLWADLKSPKALKLLSDHADGRRIRKLVDLGPDLMRKLPDIEARLPDAARFLAGSTLPDDALTAFLKIADRGTSDATALRLARKVMQSKDLPGLEKWTKLASRQLDQPGQLLDLENSLDDAMKLRPTDAATEIEVYYEKGTGKKLTGAEAKAKAGRTVNVDVETSSMRREHKRVNVEVADRKTLLHQVQDGRLKFRDAGLQRGLGGKKNVVVVDYGSSLKIDPKDALDEIRRFVGRDAITRQHVDELIVRIAGAEHVIVVP